MTSTDFSISWIHGELRAARMRHGMIVDTWSASRPVEDLSGFSQGCHDACIALGMRHGLDVSVLYEGTDLHHLFLDAPVMSAADLQTYLKRKAELEAPFDEASAWSYRLNEGAGLSNHVLLHTMPQRVVDAVARICGENHVVPRKLLPITEVISHQIAQATLREDALLLVAACFTDITLVTVARGSGQILLVRELGFGSRDAERLGGELNRTGLFAKQRLRENIDEAWIIGANAEQFAAQAQSSLECPVIPISRSTEPDFWLTEVAIIDQSTPANLITKATRRARNGRKLQRFGLWATAALLLATLALSLFQHLVIYALPAVASTTEVEADIERLERAVNQLTLRGEHVQGLSERARLIEDTAPPMPAWFLENLAALVVPGARFTAAAMEARGDGWRFELAGDANPPLALAADAVATVVNRLEAPPWNAAISADWKEQWLEELRNGGAVLDSHKPFRVVGHVK